MQRSNERAIEPPAQLFNGLKKNDQDNFTINIETRGCQAKNSNPTWAALVDTVDHLSVYGREVQLHNAGNGRFRGLCPFHADRNSPSFYIFRDKKFYCFGCGERGDLINFVQKVHGLSFPEALRFLGIERGEVTPELRVDIKRRKQKSELAEAFRAWERAYADKLATQIRATRKVMMSGLLTPENLDGFAPMIQRLSMDEHHFFDILCGGDDSAKVQLFKEKGGHDDF